MRPLDELINKPLLGDCLELMKEIPDGSIDLIVTDPPYFIESLKENLKDTTLRRNSKNNIFFNEFDHFESKDKYKEFMKQCLTEWKRILRDKGQVYMFFSYHHLDWIITMIKEENFVWKKPLIWYKPDTMGVFPNQYGCNYENILWFRKAGENGKFTCHIGNGQRDVFQVNSTNIKVRKEGGYHPTIKPLSIVRQLILNGSDKGNTVLDCFGGSGTTAVACKEVQRNFIIIERNKSYYETILKRLKNTSVKILEKKTSLSSFIVTEK